MSIPFIGGDGAPEVRPLREAKERTPSRPSWMLAHEPEPAPPPPEFNPETVAAMQNSLRLLAEASKPVPRDPNEIVELAFTVVRGLLQDELKTRPTALSERVEHALEHLKSSTDKQVRLHPRLAKELGEPPEGVSFIIDDSLEPGAVLVETAERALDVSWENQLQRFEAELRQTLEEERAA